jgi:hypothetical protein
MVNSNTTEANFVTKTRHQEPRRATSTARELTHSRCRPTALLIILTNRTVSPVRSAASRLPEPYRAEYLSGFHSAMYQIR